MLNQLCPLNERCGKLHDLNFNHPNGKSDQTHPPHTRLPSHSQAVFSQILTFSLALSAFSLFSQFLPINSELFFTYLLFARQKNPNNVNRRNYYCVRSMFSSEITHNNIPVSLSSKLWRGPRISFRIFVKDFICFL